MGGHSVSAFAFSLAQTREIDAHAFPFQHKKTAHEYVMPFWKMVYLYEPSVSCLFSLSPRFFRTELRLAFELQNPSQDFNMTLYTADACAGTLGENLSQYFA